MLRCGLNIAMLTFVPVSFAQDVIVGTAANFADLLETHERLYVYAHTPWCKPCKKLKPEYEKAAVDAQAQGLKVKLASIDADAEPQLKKSLQLRTYPSFVYYVKSVKQKGSDRRTAKEIVDWLAQQEGQGGGKASRKPRRTGRTIFKKPARQIKRRFGSRKKQGRRSQHGGCKDGGCKDGGCKDGGCPDGGCKDGGCEDGGCTDGGCKDGGCPDGGCKDVGSKDGGCTDGGCKNGGCPDGGCPDGGCTDGGCKEGGCKDGGCANGGCSSGGYKQPRLRGSRNQRVRRHVPASKQDLKMRISEKAMRGE